MFLIPSLFTSFNQKAFLNNDNLSIATDNYLFNGTEYAIELNDIYDDENLTKIYTGANFQSSSFNYTTYDWNDSESEAVSPVNNSESVHPKDIDVDMTTGTFDDTDNMQADDGSYSVFTSTEAGLYPSIYYSYNSFEEEVGLTDDDLIMVDTFTASTSLEILGTLDGHSTVQKFRRDGGIGWRNFQDTMTGRTSGTIEYWVRTENAEYYNFRNMLRDSGSTKVNVYFQNTGQIRYQDSTGHYNLQAYAINTWYHVRIDFEFGAGGYLGLGADKFCVTINDGDSTSGEVSMVNTGTQFTQMWIDSGASGVTMSTYLDAVGYSWDGYTPGDNLVAPTPDIDAGISSPKITEYENDGLLSLNIITSHYTNISTAVSMNLWNYDTTSWINLGSSTKTSEFKNEFSITANIDDYFDDDGKLLFSYNTSTTVDHEIRTDYIEFLLVYKMDLTHSITFETNGLWKYRWELIGSLQYTDWTYFEVVDPVPNFHAVSSSEVLTRWVLQGSNISPVEDFHDDINTNYWDLSDVSIRTMAVGGVVLYASFAVEDDPDDDWYCSWSSLAVSDGGGLSSERRTFLASVWEDFFLLNNTGDSWLRAYTVGQSDNYVYSYHTTIFNENTLTWNTMPALGDYQNTSTADLSIDNNWVTIPLGDPADYYALRHHDDPATYRDWSFASDDWTGTTYDPRIYHNYSKNYFGSGYMYMQTDTTESIALKSQDYGTHKILNSGDYFEVDFETSSDSQINLILLKDGVVNKTLTLSGSGNTNFNRHIVQIPVDELVEFDQLKIQSTFEDEDYTKIYDIKTMKYTLTGDHDDFYVSPNNHRDVYLAPDSYNLRIFEEGDEKVDVNITITSSDYYYTYQPTPRFQCRLTLHSVEGINLDLTDFHIWVNRSNGGSYSDFNLLDNTFNVDEDTMVYFNVSDRFDNLINTFQQVASDYIDLELEVYSLKIKNLMEQQTTVDINSTQIFPVLSGELIEYILSKNYYEIGYYDSNNAYKQFTIYLDSNQAYELNRSRICFLSYADQQGTHLTFENYKTFLNGSLIYENIFYKEIGEDVNITIKDRYDIQIHSEIYTVVSGDNYIPITLTMYSLKIMNQQEVFNHINITRNPDYYESSMYWSEFVAPTEIIEFKLFSGYYKINLTNEEQGSSSLYSYTLNGDDVILISSGNIISNLITNIANVNTTIGNQITNVQIDLTNQNSDINNTIINIDINLSNVNSSLGTLLTNINLDITNINNNISELYTFTENNFLNLGNNINNSFTLIENNIIAINQTISTLVIGLDGKVSIVNATINTMFTEMNSQFIVTQSTLDFSFTFLNQTITQIGNNITSNHIALNNLIIQRANDIDNSLIEISILVNLINSSIVNESLVIQSLVNIIGNNITENHVIINDLINLIGNNITENNVNMISLIELVGNNITTNHFVIQTLIDYVSNNITDNHLEFLTNINLINNTIGQNQIELINRLLFINNSINAMALDLTNQILLVNNTIYSAILDVSTSIDFTSDNILGNISLTYQQNDFLTELYQTTMFSQLLNWSDVAYNYSIMEDRIDVWDFINNYKNDSITVFLRYGDLIDNLTISAQNTIEQFLPSEDVEYRLWSVENEEYLSDWVALPENRTVNFGFYEAEIIPEPFDGTILMIVFGAFVIGTVGYLILLRTNLKFQKRNLFSVQKKPMKKVNLNKNLNSKSWKKNFESET